MNRTYVLSLLCTINVGTNILNSAVNPKHLTKKMKLIKESDNIFVWVTKVVYHLIYHDKW